MVNPLLSTINNVYISGHLNSQWNANGGTFGLDPNNNTPFVGVTDTPSFIGASIYDSTNSSFSALITPATAGNGSTQTSLLIKSNENNYVEMFLGPQNNFGGYVANNSVVTSSSSPFPTYNPTNHAYWRIRNGGLQFFFETSPNGTTWTTLGGVPYSWDATSVTVMFLAGFTGSEVSTNKAYISNINGNVATTTTSTTTSDLGATRGHLVVTTSATLHGTMSGFSGLGSKLSVISYLPEGGLTDFGVTDTSVNSVDPVMARGINASVAHPHGGTSRVWDRGYITTTTPNYYRDGSYWSPATSSFMNLGADTPDTNTTVVSSIQLEKIQIGNKLSLTASYYTDSCEYAAQKSTTTSGLAGSTSVTRSPVVAYAGNYSGQMVYSGTPVVDGAGNNAYWPYATKKALAPVVNNTLGQETLRGTVALYTTRANTSWYAAMILYDASFNILSNTTFRMATITNMNTHPGGGVWQTGTVLMPATASAAWAAVVPVVLSPVSGTETVYMSGHRIESITPAITGFPSAYQDPGNLTIELKADRVNYMANSGFINNTNRWGPEARGTTGSPSPLTVNWDGTVGFNSVGSMRVDLATPSGTWAAPPGSAVGTSSQLVLFGAGVFPSIEGLLIGHTYTFSAWVKQGSRCPDVFMSVTDANYNGVSNVSVNAVKISNPSEVVNGWTRVHITFTIPPNSGSDYRIAFDIDATLVSNSAPFSFWVDSILVEETNLVNDYFDGNFSSPDYQFENQTTSVFVRSYYYKDFTNKLSRVNRIIPQFSPLGTTATILTAQSP